MQLSRKVANGLYYARETLYTGYLRSFIQKHNINRYISKPYWNLLHRVSDGTVKQSIESQTVYFNTRSTKEFQRFQNFVGERAVIKDLLTSLEDGDVFYDVGANVGTYTCFAASKLESESVVSFEPEPQNARRLRENLELNNLGASILRVALSNQEGTIDLALSGEEAGEGEHSIATDSTSNTIEVKTTKGDSVADTFEVPKPSVVKIDVEGAEMSVIEGLQNTLQENCRLIYVEAHPKKMGEFGNSVAEIRESLEDLGFNIVQLENGRSQIFFKGEK